MEQAAVILISQYRRCDMTHMCSLWKCALPRHIWPFQSIGATEHECLRRRHASRGPRRCPCAVQEPAQGHEGGHFDSDTSPLPPRPTGSQNNTAKISQDLTLIPSTSWITSLKSSEGGGRHDTHPSDETHACPHGCVFPKAGRDFMSAAAEDEPGWSL